jgi:hypothetical protein
MRSLRDDFVDAGCWVLDARCRLVVQVWIVGWGEKRIRRRRDQNLSLSYIGEAGWQNSFGGNLLIDNALQLETG